MFACNLSFYLSMYQLLFFSGDEILEVNGESLHGLTHLQAIQTFKVHFMDAVWSSNWDLLYLRQGSFEIISCITMAYYSVIIDPRVNFWIIRLYTFRFA